MTRPWYVFIEVGFQAMLCLLVVAIFALLHAGCLPAINHPRVERALDVPDGPGVVWPRAVKATMAVQGQIHQQDARLGMINASVQRGGVTLDVVITPQGSGSHIVVAHQVAPTHVSVGTVTLSDDWIAAYRAQQ
jgi:hypothetical protein